MVYRQSKAVMKEIALDKIVSIIAALYAKIFPWHQHDNEKTAPIIGEKSQP